MNIELDAWNRFEKTGKVEDYISYRNAVALYRGGEEDSDGCHYQRSYSQKTEYRRAGRDLDHFIG